jgi:hypothetical protein
MEGVTVIKGIKADNSRVAYRLSVFGFETGFCDLFDCSFWFEKRGAS